MFFFFSLDCRAAIAARNDGVKSQSRSRHPEAKQSKKLSYFCTTFQTSGYAMLQTIKHYIERNNLISQGDKIVVGLSGGADSTILLSILCRLGYDCLAAHCNFHLRAEESDRDEKFAYEFAASIRVPFFKQDFDTRTVAKERGISIEMAARDLRYKWFEELRGNENAVAIAVAHHQDDSIETLLLNLIRGTGIKGLTGIKPRNGQIIRPLLCVSKADILQYAQTENLPYMDDSSNRLPEFARNKIRLQALPLLKTLNPSVNEALAQTMYNLNEAAKIYDTEIEKEKKSVFNKESGRIHIPLLKTFPSPETLLFELLKDFGFGKEVVFEIDKSINSQPGKTFYSNTHRLVKDRDAFLLTPLEEEKGKGEIYLIQPDERSVIERPFRMEITCTDKFTIQFDRHIACLDKDKLRFPLILRKWEPGDKFMPLGMSGFQKLSDFFTNLKLSKPQKEKIWALFSGEDIVWVVNYRIDDRFKIGLHTKNACILRIL
ncbi:MAG: tRNA lysidine(34) synthetase TilS [Dysgonamonadaceae bacterium]|jgi:tRNA(Ile)-lysidine synthase|nr:tRNA lysidine(34) synthetase TilS [Dysgonamonadaceae bacterium]